MSEKNFLRVQGFLRALQNVHSQSWWRAYMAEDVYYSVYITGRGPQVASFQGISEVVEYLSMIASTYQVLKSEDMTLLADDSRVIVRGGEIARLKMFSQLVRTQWVSVVSIEQDLIRRFVMTIHHWDVLAGGGSMAVDRMESNHSECYSDGPAVS